MLHPILLLLGLFLSLVMFVIMYSIAFMSATKNYKTTPYDTPPYVKALIRRNRYVAVTLLLIGVGGLVTYLGRDFLQTLPMLLVLALLIVLFFLISCRVTYLSIKEMSNRDNKS
ncbi:MAG: hypothetical protein JWN64_375 [Parcubacteria group bacterium]|nr:hypothetical protein [Parcubacteria group bacterium]